MGRIRVVVDSSADFASLSVLERHNIVMVPGAIHFGDDTFIDRVEMEPEAFLKRMGETAHLPTVSAPSAQQYADVFARLNRETDKIISLHNSRALSNSYQNGKMASQTLLGRCDIAVIDSMTTSAGLGLLAEAAAKMAERTQSMDDVVRIIRGVVSRIYSIFYVDTLSTLQQRELLGEAQSIIGTMLGIKPFLTIEDGHLITMEKVRTRSQAVDKLVEFVMEFTAIEKLVILQHSPFMSDAVRLLQDRLAAELSQRNFPTVIYGATLGALLGTDATGVVVMERDES